MILVTVLIGLALLLWVRIFGRGADEPPADYWLHGDVPNQPPDALP